MVTYKALHEPPRRLMDWWISMGWCAIDLGADQTIVLFKLTRFMRDRGTDGPV